MRRSVSIGTRTVADTLEASLRATIASARRLREQQFESFLNEVDLELTDEQLHELRYAEPVSSPLPPRVGVDGFSSTRR